MPPRLSLAPASGRLNALFGSLEGWDAFTVLRIHAVEEISRLFCYEVTLQRDPADGPIDLDGLIDTGATLRFSTALRWRAVHGVVAEAEELDRTATSFFYRVRLVPHLARAMHRGASRTFVQKSVVEIVSAVLENKAPGNASGAGGLIAFDGALTAADDPPGSSPFAEPKASYRFQVDARLSAPRPFVVQYGESDFAFISRLLEEEGVAYVVEHGLLGSVLTMTDRPVAPLFARADVLTLQASTNTVASANLETIRSLTRARRARSRAVRVRGYVPRTPLSLFESEATREAAATRSSESFEFPAPEVSAGEPLCDHAAAVRLERFVCESALAQGTGNVRSLEPGVAFVLTDASGVREDAALYVVRLETLAVVQPVVGDPALDALDFGFEDGPAASPAALATPSFEARFTVLPANVVFRPERRTPRPRISGVHPAIVTAEEALPSTPEINADKDGSVRLRFPWDLRPVEAGVPSSRWVRVAQYWAGIGYGALHTPRVGHHVLVAFRDGDPDRPVVVGRMYSDQQPSPYDVTERPTVSTLKSNSSPGGDGFNEFRFEDKKGSEEIFLHAEKELNEVVLGSHSTSVGGDQSNSVGHNQSNSVSGNRTHDVRGTELVHVHGDRTTLFDAFLTTTVGISESRNVGANRNSTIGENEIVAVGLVREIAVGTNDNLTVGATKTTTIFGQEVRSVASKRTTSIAATDYLSVGGDLEVGVGGEELHVTGEGFSARVGGCKLVLKPGFAMLTNGAGATIALAGGQVLIAASGGIVQTAAGAIDLASGGATNVAAGGDINAAAPNIHLNG